MWNLKTQCENIRNYPITPASFKMMVMMITISPMVTAQQHAQMLEK